MFNKLLSNVAINPSALDQFVHFSKRLKKEQNIRKLGLYFLIFALLIQFVPAITPNERSLTFSSSHILNGISSKEDILDAWDLPNSDLPEIYGLFGVTKQDIKNLPERPNSQINPTVINNYWSISRQPLTGLTSTDEKLNNQLISFKSDETEIYMRPLHSWNNGSGSVIPAFEGRNSSNGKPFWILADSGSYVQLGRNIKKDPPKKSKLVAKKSLLNNSQSLIPGEEIIIKIEYRNTVPGSLAENVIISDQIDTEILEVTNSPELQLRPDGKFEYKIGNVSFTDFSRSISIVAKLKSAQIGKNICSPATIFSSNSKTVFTNSASNLCQKSLVENTLDSEIQETISDLPPSLSSNVSNVTKSLSGIEASNTTVDSGDLLEFKLKASNTSDNLVSDYDISYYVGDIIDYAEINFSSLNNSGGTYDKKTQEIRWANQTLSAYSETERVVQAKVKNPIPSTNRPSVISTSYDCKISSYFGDEITLTTNCPPLKKIETFKKITPLTSIYILGASVILATYLYLRSRLLAQEAKIIKKEFQRLG